jgi:hypothetical protein
MRLSSWTRPRRDRREQLPFLYKKSVFNHFCETIHFENKIEH